MNVTGQTVMTPNCIKHFQSRIMIVTTQRHISVFLEHIRVILQHAITIMVISLTFLLGTVETISIKPRLALTLEGSQSIDTSGIDVTWRGAAFVLI